MSAKHFFSSHMLLFISFILSYIPTSLFLYIHTSIIHSSLLLHFHTFIHSFLHSFFTTFIHSFILHYSYTFKSSHTFLHYSHPSYYYLHLSHYHTFISHIHTTLFTFMLSHIDYSIYSYAPSDPFIYSGTYQYLFPRNIT